MRTAFRWWIPVSMLAAAAAACDSVNSSGAGGGGPGGTPGDSPTPVSSGTPGATPTPGPVPDHLGGWFSIGNIHSRGNNPPAGVGGSGFFSAQPIPLGLTQPFEDLMNEYPNQPINTCGWGWGASIAIGGSGQVSVSAGDVSLTSANGSGKFLLLPLGGLNVYIANAMPGVYLPTGGEYTLAATGGSLPAFSTTFTGPADVQVTDPANLASADTIVINRTQDFPLKWESANDGLPVFVYLLHYQDADNPHTSAPQVVVCKFDDNGSATIPASAFQMFDATLYGSVDAFQVMKYRVSMFTAQYAPGPVMVNFAAGYNLDATYQ